MSLGDLSLTVFGRSVSESDNYGLSLKESTLVDASDSRLRSASEDSALDSRVGSVVPTVREIHNQLANEKPRGVLLARRVTRALSLGASPQNLVSTPNLIGALSLSNSLKSSPLSIPRSQEDFISQEQVAKAYKKILEDFYLSSNLVFVQDDFEEYYEKIGTGVNHSYILRDIPALNIEGEDYLEVVSTPRFIVKPSVPPPDLISTWTKKITEILEKNPQLNYSVAALEELLKQNIFSKSEDTFFDYIPFETILMREKIAYVVGDKLGVPYCSIIKHPKLGFCSKHEFITNEGNLYTKPPLDPLEVDLQSIQNIWLLDLLFVSQDRNRENVLVQRVGEKVRLIPIDHGYILPRTLFFEREKENCIESFKFFQQDLPLTESSLEWMKALDREDLNKKIREIGAVDLKTLEVIDFTATLLRVIGNHSSTDRLLTSDLYQLFLNFEQELRKMYPVSESPSNKNETICLLTIVNELKRDEDLDSFCQRIMGALIEKMARAKSFS